MLGLHALRKWRKTNNVTLAALADRVGVFPSHISQIETGKSDPSLALAAKLSRETGLPLDDFVNDQRAGAA